MRSSVPPPAPARASAIALSLGTSSSICTSEFCRKTWPLLLTETASGSLLASRLAALVCGRSIGTPTVSSGADTMKMISNTSMTSTMGVTLISAITGLRRCRRRPNTPECAPPLIPMVNPLAVPLLATLIDLARQNCGKLVGKTLQPLGLPVHLGDELVIENRRRYGCDEADGGRKQRFRDARRHLREPGAKLPERP